MDDETETIELSPRAYREALTALARAWTNPHWTPKAVREREANGLYLGGLASTGHNGLVHPDMAISLAINGARWDSMLGVGL